MILLRPQKPKSFLRYFQITTAELWFALRHGRSASGSIVWAPRKNLATTTTTLSQRIATTATATASASSATASVLPMMPSVTRTTVASSTLAALALAALAIALLALQALWTLVGVLPDG